jgi:hypothetical protein
MNQSATIDQVEAVDDAPESTVGLELPDLTVFNGAATGESPATAGDLVGEAVESISQRVESLAAAATGGELTADPRARLEKEIQEQQIEVANLAVSHSRKQAEAKSVKKELDLAVEDLRDMEGRLERGEFSLPFTGLAGEGGAGAAGSGGSAPLAGQLELPIEDNAWKSVPLSELGLTGKLAESLTEAGLTTMGAIAEYTGSEKRLTDIAGIGPGKAEKVEQACEAYWVKNPRAGGNDVPADPADNREDNSAAARAAGSESADETEVYTAGRQAMTDATESAGEDEDPEIPKNPHKSGTRLWQMFDKGVQDVLAN